MSTAQRLLSADTAGPQLQKLYHMTGILLAGAVPTGFLTSDGSTAQKMADLAMGVVIPLHAHVGMNGVVSDYVPPGLQRPVRYGVAGASVVMGLGLLKLNTFGPGVTRSIKQIWAKDKQ